MAMVELPLLLLLPLLFIPSLEAICLAHHCIVVVVTQDWLVGRLVRHAKAVWSDFIISRDWGFGMMKRRGCKGWHIHRYVGWSKRDNLEYVPIQRTRDYTGSVVVAR